MKFRFKTHLMHMEGLFDSFLGYEHVHPINLNYAAHDTLQTTCAYIIRSCSTCMTPQVNKTNHPTDLTLQNHTMITFEVNLPSRSLFAFITWIMAIPPCVFAITLARFCYHETQLEIPLYLLGAFLAVEAIAKISSGFFANNYYVLGFNWLLLLAQFVAGTYWICARFSLQNIEMSTKQLHYEILLVVLWAVNILVSTNVQTILLYACWVDPIVLVEKPLPEATPSPTHQSFEEWSSPKQPRTHRSTGSLVSFKRKHRSNPSNTGAHFTSLSGLEAVPEGFMDMSWTAGSTQIPFIINPDGSRTVSGSTQQSNLFGATEYNKRITSAGFIKDEPVPRGFNKIATKSRTFSQYDQEQRIHDLAL